MHFNVVDTHAALFEIDQNLDRLVKNIELLNYLNPLYIEQEKKRFFASKFTEEPQFKYRKIKFSPFKLQRLFFNQRLERITDDDVRRLYRDIIYEYSGLIECIDTIGKGKSFYYNSLKVFGTPNERDVENARFILHFEDEDEGQKMDDRFTAHDAVAYFEDFGKRYDFDFNIKQDLFLSIFSEQVQSLNCPFTSHIFNFLICMIV